MHKSQPRLLTEEEMEYILDFIELNEGIPYEVAKALQEKNKNRLKHQLKNEKIYPELIEEIKETMKLYYYKTIAQPGESVGILTAQSIGERQTQQTLNTFHSAGMAIKTVITGVPRFSELLNATKEPKARSSQIFFKRNNDSIQNLRNLIGNTIREFKFKNLITKYKIHKDKEREDWYDMFDLIYPDNIGYSSLGGYSISFNMNKELLYEYKISLESIVNRIDSSLEGVICVFSPDFLGKIDIFVDTSEIEVAEDMDNFEDACRYHLRDVVIPSLFQVHICGIQFVENLFLDKKGNEWFGDTEGSNFQEILGLSIVDQSRVLSNDMWEIYHTLGIEAARNFLIDEFTSVISSDGTDVNDSHAILLVDLMTFSGNIVAISRYGHKKENCGPMAKASFEESLENFLKAGVFGEKESTNGVSASVMLGKVPRVGTGLCDVLIDVKALPGCPSYLKEKIEEVV
jgi:DNA-directed RNA polymerase beta' subunit